ncbi:UNVERIFIED_CONTAM: Lignin-forming anionic peroxidase [Sesamum latifolium]|uniref:Lignin-forming anionic peroxidase n=1 Tax=Sesamum latifolium TaxID=2727402 RepID=A0AAW2Y1C0_9LAMI
MVLPEPPGLLVSCADVLAAAARDASAAVGAPLRLGRRDSTTASRSLEEAIFLVSETVL